ncbi:hypothetical protein D3C76_488800 [compost metagenome]
MSTYTETLWMHHGIFGISQFTEFQPRQLGAPFTHQLAQMSAEFQALKLGLHAGKTIHDVRLAIAVLVHEQFQHHRAVFTDTARRRRQL